MNTAPIKALIYAKPFYPFTLFLKNGSTYSVTDPENCWVSPFGVYIVHGDPQILDILDPDLIEKVQMHSERGRNGQHLSNNAAKEPSVDTLPDQLTVKEVTKRDPREATSIELPQKFSFERLTVKEASERLRVHPWTIYAWARSGRLPCIRLTKRTLRFLESDIAKFEKLHTTGRIRD